MVDYINKLFFGDCREILPKIPDNSVQQGFTDPPYNIAEESKLTKKGNNIVSNKEAWGNDFEDNYSEEEYILLMKFIAEEYYRILEDGANLLIFFDRNKPYYLKPFNDLFTIKNKIIFIKSNPIPHMRKNNYRNGYEECAWFCKGDKPKTFNFISQEEMINVKYGNIGNKKTKHPTEKYRWMIEPIINVHTAEGDVILDCFMGSGSIPAYAKKNNRNYIGIENNKKYFDIACTRINKIISLNKNTFY